MEKVPGFADARLAISLGKISGYTPFRQTGSIPMIGASATVWGVGGLYDWDAIASQVAISGIVSLTSSNVADASKQVKIFGLRKSDDTLYEETVTLDATDPTVTPVNTIEEFSHVYKIRVVSTTTNTGVITAVIGSENVAKILASETTSKMCVFVVPAGKKLWVEKFVFGVTKQNVAGEAKGELYVSRSGEAFAPLGDVGVNVNGTSKDRDEIDEVYEAGARLEGIAFPSATDESFTATIIGVLIDKDA